MLPEAKECMGLSAAGRDKEGTCFTGFGGSMALPTAWFQTYSLQIPVASSHLVYDNL